MMDTVFLFCFPCLEGRAAVRVLSQETEIFLQRQPGPGHECGMGDPHIAEMPGFMGDSGDGLFPGGVAQDEAMRRRLFPEGLADADIGEVGTDEIYVLLAEAQVDGKAGLVFAVARDGYIFFREFQPAFPYSAVPDLVLLLEGAPAADGGEGLPLMAAISRSSAWAARSCSNTEGADSRIGISLSCVSALRPWAGFTKIRSP